MADYRESLFIFRRDYRLDDNLGLIEALNSSDEVLPIFILTPEQLDAKQNRYKSTNAVQFMIESLIDLDSQLRKKKSKLFMFYGSPDKVVEKILKAQKNIEAVYVNEDYSPYSKERDGKIAKVCEQIGVDFHQKHDCLLQPVGSVKTGGGTVYSKFTPFFNASKKKTVLKPKSNNKSNYVSSKTRITGQYGGKLSKFYGSSNPNLWKTGGRQEALKIIAKSSLKEHKNYNKERNDLNKETTNLSAYIKFGCVSIREVYYAFKDTLGTKNDLIKQLYWRDFYHNLLWAYPHVVGGAMKQKYNQIKWINNKTHFKHWMEGTTGYPIVDAAMRSMNETGFMHNRARLIVSNFLIKILMIDWRWGEKYFSQKLMDIDIANNNGNWQWGASTGADSQPYFRIFNPWTQGQKFDPEAEYIKYWIPELAEVPAKHLHEWDKHAKDYQDQIDYPAPIVDYSKGREEALKRYKAVV